MLLRLCMYDNRAGCILKSRQQCERQVETHIVHGKSLPKPLDFTSVFLMCSCFWIAAQPWRKISTCSKCSRKNLWHFLLVEAVWLSALLFSVIIGQAPCWVEKILVQILLARWNRSHKNFNFL